MAGLSCDFTLEQDVLVLIDDLVVGQNCTPTVILRFFLIYITCEHLVDISKLGLVLFLHLKLCQVITDLLTVPALRLPDLIDDLVSV